MIDCRSVASTRTNTTGAPFSSETMSSSTNPSRISATSPSLTMVPSSRVMSGMSSNSSPMLRLATVCSTTPPDSVCSSPNVRLRDARCTAADTWEIDRSLRRNSSSPSSIAISRSRVPRSVTSEMDGSSSSAPRTSSAASRNSFSLAIDDETARVSASTTGRASFISGRSAFGGGKLSMASTAFRTVSSMLFASAKVAISILTKPTPSVAVATTRSTPARPTTLSSTRRTMFCSTSTGDDPGAGTVTVTVRRSMAGKPWTGSRSPAASPPAMKTSMSRLAATGFSAK